MNPTRIRYPITIEQPLASLLQYCVKDCYVLCCGLGALDLSPIHVASWLRTVDPTTLADLLLQLHHLRREAANGFVLHCESWNSIWTQAEFLDFLMQIKRLLDEADEVIRFAEKFGPNQ